MPVNFPHYEITFTNKNALVESIVNGTVEVAASGAFDISDKKEIVFTQEISEKLDEIGYFNAEPASAKYRIMTLNSKKMRIEFTFVNDSGDKEFKGFFIRR